LVWIQGHSGTGEPRLTESLATTAQKRGGGLWGRGKFERHQHIPYAGLTQACAEICATLLQQNKEDTTKTTKSQLLSDLQTSVESELDVLLPFVPALAELIDPAPQGRSMDNIVPQYHHELSQKDDFYWYTATQEGKKRFQFAFVRFVETLLRHVRALVLVLDDLQWFKKRGILWYQRVRGHNSAVNLETPC